MEGGESQSFKLGEGGRGVGMQGQWKLRLKTKRGKVISRAWKKDYR